MCKCCTKSAIDPPKDVKKDQLIDKIALFQKEPGSLIPVLQEAQELFGYLSDQVMLLVAKELRIPIAHVYGVATFYSQFRFIPRGQYVIRVCMGTACHVRGALKVLKTLERELGIKSGDTTPDQKYTLETVACIGACGLAPVISINNRVFGNVTVQMVPGILEKFE